MSEQKSWKLVNFCEFDKYATKSYCAIHGVDESLNLGDITEVDENKIEDFNMMCFGSPCQDFSLSGAQKGSMWECKDCGEKYNPLTVHHSERELCPKCKSDNINKTRSSLIVEGLRMIKGKKPNWIIYENVKALTGNKFKDTFNMFINELNEYGYNTHYKVLNARDFGIPQNRERVFVISIRKDLDNGKFKFPESFDNGLRLKDMLEEHVDEKYYISQDKVQRFLDELKNTNSKVYHKLQGIDKSYNKTKSIEVANCITAREDRGISNRIAEGTAVLEIPDYSYCLDANYWKGTTIEQYVTKCRRQLVPESDVRIRKLTPKECFRLMGFSDEDYEKASSVNSNTQLYKQCGNSIVTNVLYYIYVELYTAMPYLFDDLKLSSFFSGIGSFEIALDKLYEGINSGNFTNPQVE